MLRFIFVFLIDYISNNATLGVIGEDTDAIPPEVEEVKETPQQLAEWTPDNVF